MMVSSIEDMMRQAEQDIREKKSLLSTLSAEGDFDPYSAAQLRREIRSQEEVLNRCRSVVREEKIGKILPEQSNRFII